MQFFPYLFLLQISDNTAFCTVHKLFFNFYKTHSLYNTFCLSIIYLCVCRVKTITSYVIFKTLHLFFSVIKNKVHLGHFEVYFLHFVASLIIFRMISITRALSLRNTSKALTVLSHSFCCNSLSLNYAAVFSKSFIEY